MKILTYPDERLKMISEPIANITDEIVNLAETMIEIMNKKNGLGLAAIQIGVDKRMFVYDIYDRSSVFINPEIISSEGIIISEGEGCLSVPGISSNIKRAKKILIKGLDIDGTNKEFEADGLMSIVFQHEIDHLNGILFIDHFSKLKRKLYEKKLLKKREKVYK